MGWRVVQQQVPLRRVIGKSRSETEGDEPEEGGSTGTEDESPLGEGCSIGLATTSVASGTTYQGRR